MNRLTNKKVTITKQDYFFIIGAFVVFALLLWKAPFGTGGRDEPFFLTVPHRLAKGDSLLSEEWHLSQLSGFLLYPLMKVYLFFAHSTEGILVNFRYFYVFFQMIVAVILYLNLKKFGLAGVLASLLFVIFAPYDMMALSYNTMGLGLVAISGVLMGTMEKLSKRRLFLTGVLYTGAVICCPYLVIGYVIYSLATLIHLFSRRVNSTEETNNRSILEVQLALKSWITVTMGIAMLSIIFVLFLLSRASISEIISNLPGILNDPEHVSRSLLQVIVVYKEQLVFGFKGYIYLWSGIILISILDKSRIKRRGLYFIVMSISVIACIITFLSDINETYNYIMLPITVLGLLAYILCKHKNKPLFIWSWFGGFIYSFCLSWTSNQKSYAISMAIAASGIASMIFIFQLLKEMGRNEKRRVIDRVVSIVAICFVVIQIFAQVYVKLNHAYWEDSVSGLTTTIQEGPLKGIKTAPDKVNSYNLSLDDIREYASVEEGNILFATKPTWYYLYADLPYGCPSAWITRLDIITCVQWIDYFTLHPDKIPQYVYIPKGEGWDEEGLLSNAPKYNYSVTETTRGYMLERIAE